MYDHPEDSEWRKQLEEVYEYLKLKNFKSSKIQSTKQLTYGVLKNRGTGVIKVSLVDDSL